MNFGAGAHFVLIVKTRLQINRVVDDLSDMS